MNPPIYDALKVCIKNESKFFILIQKLEQINPSVFDEMQKPYIISNIDELNISSKDKISCNLIYLAIQNKNERLIEYALKINPNLNYLLVSAVDTKDCKIVDLVLKYNSSFYSVNEISPTGSPIWFAVRDNNIPIVERLLKLDNINPNIGLKNGDNTPLIVTIKIKYFEIAKMLIQHPKIDACRKNHLGKDAISIAINTNQSELIRMLIEKGDKDIYARYAMILYGKKKSKSCI